LPRSTGPRCRWPLESSSRSSSTDRLGRVGVVQHVGPDAERLAGGLHGFPYPADEVALDINGPTLQPARRPATIQGTMTLVVLPEPAGPTTRRDGRPPLQAARSDRAVPSPVHIPAERELGRLQFPGTPRRLSTPRNRSRSHPPMAVAADHRVPGRRGARHGRRSSRRPRRRARCPPSRPPWRRP